MKRSSKTEIEKRRKRLEKILVVFGGLKPEFARKEVAKIRQKDLMADGWVAGWLFASVIDEEFDPV